MLIPPVNSIKPIIVNISLPASYDDNCIGVDDNKYILCSLLLQIGTFMGIRPLSRTSSIYKSALFQDLYRKWTLHVEGRMDVISKLSEISDGGNLILCCGDNWKLFSDADDRGEVKLLELIPAKFKKLRLTLASSTPTNDCEDPKRYISEC